VLLNLYLRSRGLTDTQIGQVLSFQSLGMVLVAFPAGLAATRARLKWLLVAATAIAAAAYAVLVTAGAFPALLVASACAGGGFVIHSVVSAPFFMRNSSPRERMTLFGVNFAVEILASVIAVAGSGWLAHRLAEDLGSEAVGLRIALLVAVGLLSLAIIPYLFIRTPPAEPRDRPKFSLRRFRHKGLLARLALPAFLVGTGAGLVIPFLNLYFRDRFDLDPGRIGAIFGVSQALTALGFAAGPIMARRLGMVRSIVTTELLSIPFFVTLAFTQNLPVAMVAFWFRGALMNMNHPISRNFAMEVVDHDEQPMANAVLELTWNLAWMVSAQVGGWVIDRHGFVPPMLATVFLYIFASMVYLRFFRDTERTVFPLRAAAEVPEP
jgi:predicted MFS family arabinose efflux permease